MINRLFFLAACLSGLIAGTYAVPVGAQTGDSAPEPDEVVIYKKSPQGDLAFHLFYPGGEKPDKPAPAMLYFFGGGWVGGHPRQFYPQAEHFNKYGIVGVCAEYRIKGKHKTDPFACVEDGVSALREIQVHGAKYGIDSSKIVVAGGSAGGHVAACSVLVKYSGAGAAKPDYLAMPVGLVLFNPVCDTSSLGFGNGRLGDRWMEISPLHLVHDKVPPVLILHGTQDTTVPFSNAINFQKAMRKLGRECKVAAYPGQKHAFFNSGRPSYEATILETEAFLEELGFLSVK